MDISRRIQIAQKQYPRPWTYQEVRFFLIAAVFRSHNFSAINDRKLNAGESLMSYVNAMLELAAQTPTFTDDFCQEMILQNMISDEAKHYYGISFELLEHRLQYSTSFPEKARAAAARVDRDHPTPFRSARNVNAINSASQNYDSSQGRAASRDRGDARNGGGRERRFCECCKQNGHTENFCWLLHPNKAPKRWRTPENLEASEKMKRTYCPNAATSRQGRERSRSRSPARASTTPSPYAPRTSA